VALFLLCNPRRRTSLDITHLHAWNGCQSINPSIQQNSQSGWTYWTYLMNGSLIMLKGRKILWFNSLKARALHGPEKRHLHTTVGRYFSVLASWCAPPLCSQQWNVSNVSLFMRCRRRKKIKNKKADRGFIKASCGFCLMAETQILISSLETMTRICLRIGRSKVWGRKETFLFVGWGLEWDGWKS